MLKSRFATVMDLPKLSHLVNSGYRGEYSKKGWTTEAHFLDGQRTDEGILKTLIEEPDQWIEIFFETSPKDFFACVLMKKEFEHLYFGMLTVEPLQQGKGWGSLIIRSVEEKAISLGISSVKLTVLHNRPELIAYYERRGYVATGNWENFPEDPAFGIPKLDHLRLLEYKKWFI
jgi:GNAT superfamily N-acetyltransferase